MTRSLWNFLGRAWSCLHSSQGQYSSSSQKRQGRGVSWSQPQPDWEARQQYFRGGHLSPTLVHSHVPLCKDLPFEIPWQLMAFTTCLQFSQIYFLKRRRKKKKKEKETPATISPLRYTHRGNNILIFLYSVFVSLSQALCVGVMWF